MNRPRWHRSQGDRPIFFLVTSDRSGYVLPPFTATPPLRIAISAGAVFDILADPLGVSLPNLPELVLPPSLRSVVRELVPVRVRRSVSRMLHRATLWPPPGAVRFGSLRRLTPISSEWGLDRGLPIDRYYIEQFLEAESSVIRGRVLEIDANTYTLRFGGEKVVRSDVLHVSEMKPGVTMVGDLVTAQHIPSNAFDCVILTQTLQFILDVGAAIETVHRILKPGGVALVTVPAVTKTQEGRWRYFWTFTGHSAGRLFEERFVGGSVHARGWGNVLAALAFLHGLAAEELKKEELDTPDPRFEVLVTIRAVKGGDSP